MSQIITTDKGKGRIILRTIMDASEAGHKCYGIKEIIEKGTPENKIMSIMQNETELKKAIWLFFICAGDRKVTSEQYYGRVKSFYEQYPDYFDSLDLSEEQLMNFAQQTKMGFRGQFAEYMRYNLPILKNKYGGNPLKLLTGEYQSSRDNFEQFKGYGPELATLSLIFHQRYKIRATTGLRPKVDSHFVKIARATGIIKMEYGTRIDQATPLVGNLLEEICNEEGYDVTKLDPAKFAFESFLCNAMDAAYCGGLCPIEPYCNRDLAILERNDTTFQPDPIKKRTQLVMFNKTSLE